MSKNDRFRLSLSIPQKLQELGVSLPAVLRQAGLPIHLLDQERVWLDTRELFAFHSAIDRVSERPAIGLLVGSEERLERYSPIAIAALYSRTFHEAMQRISRYKRLTGPQEIRLLEKAQEIEVEFAWLLADCQEPDHLVDMCMSWLVTIGRRGIGHRIHPIRLELKRSAQQREPYDEFYGCPVQFDGAANKVTFSLEDVRKPFLTYNLDLLELIAPQLEADLKELKASGTLDSQVKAIVKRFLAGQKPRLEEVAFEMRLSSRTLQRRLLAEGRNFHGLVEEARQEMARHYLLESSLELSETAYLLGFDDPNSFIRAFHRWEGVSPGEWRNARVG